NEIHRQIETVLAASAALHVEDVGMGQRDELFDLALDRLRLLLSGLTRDEPHRELPAGRPFGSAIDDAQGIRREKLMEIVSRLAIGADRPEGMLRSEGRFRRRGGSGGRRRRREGLDRDYGGRRLRR